MTSERTWDWVERTAQRLIHRSARRAPDALSERLEEEWLADLAEQHGAIRRLRFAIGCCWATIIIAREHAVAALPATSSPTGHAQFIRYPQDDFPFFTGRTITFVLVASLHVAVLYGLAMGLGPKFTKVIAGPFAIRVIEPPPRTTLPPPPPPLVARTRIELPLQEPMPPIESDPTDAVETTPREPPRAVLPPSAPTAVNRVQGGPGIGFPSTNDFYPDASIRLGERGVATVRACVDPKGRLISEPTITESTGSTRLDEGALRLAKAGSGHYRATMEDGQPVNSCYSFRIRFELRN
ncbi:MAG TPA: energy transducer TonB [Steroidobacteraceae bacterium]|jgi:TonB family protein|nr:energy transducer TonB [Steroidobacteraceae bacterium]